MPKYFDKTASVLQSPQFLSLRTFYSELLTDSEFYVPVNLSGSGKKSNLIWQVKVEDNSPLISDFVETRELSFLYPAERWITFPEDPSINFAFETFKPKLQWECTANPGEITKNVATERLCRNYQARAIKDILLKEYNLKSKDLLPVDVFKLFNFDFRQVQSHYLPLELFDDEDYDPQTPENWLEISTIRPDSKACIPGVAFIPSPIVNSETTANDLYDWIKVAIRDYDPVTKLWSILTVDGFKRSFDIPRIYLMFYAENPQIFAKRLKQAIDDRNDAENKIRYDLVLSCLKLYGIPELGEEFITKIFQLTFRKKPNLYLVESETDTVQQKLAEEIQLNYSKVLANLQFRENCNNHIKYNLIVIPDAPEEIISPPKSSVQITHVENFNSKRDYYRRTNIYVIPETYRAMNKVVSECIKISELSLFTFNYGAKYVSLDEFVTAQSHTANNLLKQMKGPWIEKITFSIRLSFGDFVKGWFDINVKKHDVYDIAKLLRFMELVKHRMQYAIRVMVGNSVQTFATLLEKPCLPCLECRQDFEWEGDLFTSRLFISPTNPIFTLYLKMDENGPLYSTDPDAFRVVLLELYDNILVQTHQIKQIHPFLLKNLRFEPNLFLSSLGLLSEQVCDARNRFLLAYEKAIIPLKAYARKYNVYAELYNMNIKTYVDTYKQEEHTALETKDEIYHHRKMRDNIEVTIPANVSIGPFYVVTETLKVSLIKKRHEISLKMLEMFAEKLKISIEQVIREYEGIVIKLGEKPTSIEQIFEIRDWMETIPLLVKGLEETTRRYVMEYEVLDYFYYNTPDDDFRNKWTAVGWPLHLKREVEQTESFLADEQDKFFKLQQNDEFAMQEQIETYTIQVVQLSKLRDFSKCHENAVEIRRLWKQMKESQEQGQLLNQRQKLFGTPVVPFDTLNKLVKEFEPYKILWITSSDWLRSFEIWMDNPLLNIDVDVIDKTVTEMLKGMVKAIRVFNDIQAVKDVAVEIKRQIEEFKPLIPLLLSLRNPGMRDRHWEIFMEKSGIVLEWSPTLTFKECLELGIADYQDVITGISESATKEYMIEQTLEKMKNEWEKNFMELTPYKATGTYIMKISEEHQQLLDDHIVMTQQLTFSPFKGPYEEDINNWETTLRITADVIEEWMNLQKSWMYLEPILNSEDISQQLPAESKKYNSMERTWRRIMRGAKECPWIIKYCGDRRLLESLRDAIHILEVVQKGLAEYLETKRMIFPRLYFLSDDELLEILSHAKDPLAVQPHLRKCFENIARLTFEEDRKITQMFSAEEECVDLNPTLYPTTNVEQWLLLVEGSMRNTVRTILGEAIIDIMKKPRIEWVLNWPGQVVIAGSQTYWTTGVEDGINKNQLNKFMSECLLVNLNDLRSLVKQPLTFLQREILSALIVIEVHSRDVTQKLVDLRINNINDFDWISQLRYYWVENELKVRAVNAEFPYGYEYLGNSGRLVITPLTDRCYLTLTGALHLKFGGAPAGPAGTGKTETTKDLAKALAYQCVVFNCSDQLDFMAMGKFFKGLASSGAWACFDEFNRIDIEVLSVVAQQITTIQKAQQARLDRFIFEDAEIVLKESCAVFITMNPGYAGRTELPDNLKALFRPVSMMVPNYSLISEISLFSFGFGNAKELANKITTTFKLSSEQLSTQDHYDFGMRAVKTVIAVAGNLKREKPEMDEKQIVLRALRDVNVPKFLKDDLKLFNGIVSDLFPRMKEEAVDYGILEESIRKSSIKLGLEDVNEFVQKVIQLYETTVVRHGLMLVGPTASGKTKNYQVLKNAMTSLEGRLQPSGYPFRKVQTYVMNPKSITMGQLYGEFDLQTHEWTDGILPCLVRIGINYPDKDKFWYIFDGPVDAVWIENMNTVLDDNKKLCLSSGEIIKLRDTMTMMFEVADLAVASPATVSRCGMVYMEPAGLGWDPFVNCWIKRLPELAVPYAENLRELIVIYVYPALTLIRQQIREILTSVDSALLVCFLRLMDFRLGPLAGRDNKPPPGPQFLELIPLLLVPWVVFSLIWSIGCTCDNEGRLVVNEWLRKLMNERNEGPAFPSAGLVYDYRLHDGGFTDMTDDGLPAPPKWVNWMASNKGDDGEFKITVDMRYSEIEVPTINNVRNAYLLEAILYNENNVLCVGPTGTGKTQTIIAKLSKNMPKKFICDFMSFSARTSANQTQDLLDSKLDRRRKGVFGPPVLKRQVFFIDDFNMPALEVYGAQPPIELIRQWMDFSGWYDRRNIGDFRKIIDVNFCAAMGPPGGGRNPVTARLLRHFHYLAFTEMEDESNRKIFGTIFKFWIDRLSEETLKYIYEPMLGSTLSVYRTILTELLPTPIKTHYTFNLRDLSKVFQGVLMFEPDHIKDLNQIIRLWYHECCRVFQDRLINDEDRTWFSQLLQEKIQTDFELNPNVCLGDTDYFYADFLDPQSDFRHYTEVKDLDQLSKVVSYYLEEYNLQSQRPMKLVLFLDAISHICRISRIVRQPLGNALLLGMGGSGRQSLTRLASFIAEYSCFQIEISKTYGASEWKEDIKKMMLDAGVNRKETVFLFSDTQIKSESFLEDLNNILNSGDVPNVYQPEDLDIIFQEMKGVVQEMGVAATKSNLFFAYQRMVRNNLHSVITMSPIGEIFRARLRQFPALVNCCTIDWFSAWPVSALQSVAFQFLADTEELNFTNEILQGVVSVCQFMHATVLDASTVYLQELSRHNYVTPTSYLELLTSYIDLMIRKKTTLFEGSFRLKNGLTKLQNTAEEVALLQVQLEEMKPALKIAALDAEVMIKQIAEDRIVAEETKAVVEKEELEATKIATETQSIAQDAQRELDEAMPALLAAEQSLKSLNKNDIVEVKAMKRPPPGVVYVIEAICIVKNIKPNKVPGLKPGEKVLDYWDPGRNMLSDPNAFLLSLMNFDKDSITQEMIDKLEAYVQNPIFTPEKVAKVSKACRSLCMWIHAMYKYYFVNLRVAPKKVALKEANEQLERTLATLNKAKAKMKAVTDNLNALQEKLNAKVAFKQEKEQSIILCEERMDRAVRLITGLSDERVRWLNTIESIESGSVNLIGDILISAGAVAYLTPFTDKYRRGLLSEWLKLMTELEIPCSADCNPVSILSEPVLIRSWQLDGLPRDYFSTENAVLVSCSKRWPLFIDPQGQANKWVKNMEKPNGLSICKLTSKDLVRTLESAVRFGKPVLIENLGVDIDPGLDPILLKLTFRQGGTVMMKLGDVTVPYDNNFKLYMTTKLPNPHYTPEISIKVLLVNFTLVSSGLQDQLLALVTAQERPDLEEQRSQIIVTSTRMKQELKEIEDRILYKLNSLEGSPLDDLDFIITLEASKVTSDDIKYKVQAAEITQIDIDNTRAQYIPVANRAQILFFCLSDLSNVDPMYQYSLEWFVMIFSNSIAETEKTDDIQQRVHIINEYFTFSLYSNVCRSLFERNKLHFAFLLCARILMDAKLINRREWHNFLAGGTPASSEPNPAPDWLSSKAWNEILTLKSLSTYENFVNTFSSYLPQYKHIFNSPIPQNEPLPEPFNSELDEFQKLSILKSLRPDKLTNAMQNFIASKMGRRFIEPQTTNLADVFKDSGPATPLIFVLSTGTDPAAELYKFADKMKMNKRMFSISLGQGQGPIAEKLMRNGMELGSWIFFQNCHLAPSWMPQLEYLTENITPESVHRDFRIWLTSMPSPCFPAAILQNGCKMTIEPPRGVKANIQRAFLNEVPDFTDIFHTEHPKAFTFKWLLFSLLLFHGVVLERRKFGPLGFNIPYEFTDGDLKICLSQLRMFLWEYDTIPFKVLSYTAGEINYGGRVTDDWDRRCLMNVLADYYNPKVVNANHVFDQQGFYHQMPAEATFLEYIEYIKTFPINDSPELFGLHQNADITFAQSQTYICLATLLSLQPKQVGGAASSEEEVVSNLANQILNQLPQLYPLKYVSEKYPVLYEESLNTVLIQECIRYNRLLTVIGASLKDLLKAMKGLVVMSESLEKMSRSLHSNLVPAIWASKAYPSLKPLGSWVADLLARTQFLDKWIANGAPAVFWISGFYFPQAFLTAILQNFARKFIVSIDSINFRYKVLNIQPTEKPIDGCHIWGLYLEGARWNRDLSILDESRPRELYTQMEVIWMVPEEHHKQPADSYECPVYKTLTRAGTLSTTGHSTNYVVALEIPSKQPQSHWIKRAVALLCALDY